MADREESIHVVIHLELDEQDKSDLQAISGTVNTASKSVDAKKVDKNIKKNTEQLAVFEAGNIGKLQNFSKTQFGNVKSMATNPAQFMAQAFIRKFAKAGIALGFAVLIWEIVQWFLDESMKAGRWLDRRFKRSAQDEILLFMTRKAQEELRRGFAETRVTTQEGLRGGQGQVSGNLFVHQVVGNHTYPSEYRQGRYDVKSTSSSRGNFATDSNGNPKGGHRLR